MTTSVDAVVRPDVKAIMRNPAQRRRLLAGAVKFIQAVEGRDITLERALEGVDRANAEHDAGGRSGANDD